MWFYGHAMPCEPALQVTPCQSKGNPVPSILTTKIPKAIFEGFYRGKLSHLLAITLALHCAPVLGIQTDVVEALLSDKDVRPGLVVHLDCGDGGLTIAMAAHPKVRVIQGVTLKNEQVEKCRSNLLDQNLFGRVSVERLAAATLPYADNLVNVLVIQNWAGLERSGLALKECLRVLAPYGVAFIEKTEPEAIKQLLAQVKIEATISAKNGWAKIVKPCPKEMDEWRQCGHDETLSARSNDKLVGPPSSVRWINWINGENWGDQAQVPGSDLVSANGRTFHLHILEKKPKENYIIARDAFNGIELWRIPATIPKELQSGLVAVPARRRVYTVCAAEYPDMLVALDETTGKMVQKYDKINLKLFSELFAESIRAGHHGDRHRWGYESGHFLFLPDSVHLYVFDESTGEKLWELTIPDKVAWSKSPKGWTRYLFQLSLPKVVKSDYSASCFTIPHGVYCIDGDAKLTCRDLHTGKVLWQAATQTKNEALYYMASGKIMTMSENGKNPKGRLRAYAAADGRFCWSQDYFYGNTRNMAVYDGALWMVMQNGAEEVTSVAVDLETGKTIKTIAFGNEFSPCDWHCFPTIATGNGLISSGCSFFDPRTLKTAAVATHARFVRPPCGVGTIPANGLLYQNLNACHCEKSLRGVLAYGTDSAPVTDGREAWRLIRGDAATAPVHGHPVSATDWPTYRHDALRSDSTSARLPETLIQKWANALPGRSSQPVVVGERVYAAVTDAHTVYALSSADGRIVWRYIASGRVDRSPTYANGRLVFGDHDGYIYCLNANNGALLWRFQAAPGSKRIMVRDQLESVWPVFGSLVARRGTVYAIAGRNNHLDGGLTLYGLDLESGTVRLCSKLTSLESTSVINDDMQDDGKLLWFDGITLNPADGKWVTGEQDTPFLYGGCAGFAYEPKFSDSTGYHNERRHQSLEVRNGKGRGIHGDSLIKQGTNVWGFLRSPGGLVRLWFKEFEIQDASYGPGFYNVKSKKEGSKEMESWLFAKGAAQWFVQPGSDKFGPKSMVKAMVKAGDTLYVAIQPNDNSPKEGLLLKYSADKGTLLGSVPLEGAPRYDSLTIAGQRVYLGTEDHRLLCLGGK